MGASDDHQTTATETSERLNRSNHGPVSPELTPVPTGRSQNPFPRAS